MLELEFVSPKHKLFINLVFFCQCVGSFKPYNQMDDQRSNFDKSVTIRIICVAVGVITEM